MDHPEPCTPVATSERHPFPQPCLPRIPVASQLRAIPDSRTPLDYATGLLFTHRRPPTC